MKKARANLVKNTRQCTDSSALFLSFCCALNKYCDQIGIYNRNFSAARILHEAAGNTLMGMQKISAPQRRYMKKMEKSIPELFMGLIKITSTNGYLNTVDRMSEMSLAQISAIVAQNARKR